MNFVSTHKYPEGGFFAVIFRGQRRAEVIHRSRERPFCSRIQARLAAVKKVKDVLRKELTGQ